MKRFYFFAPAMILIFLSGCAQYAWVGRNPDQDMPACQLDAIRQFPPVMQSTQIDNGYRSPVFTNCTGYAGIATCNSTGGIYTPPTVITTDANSGNRGQYVKYCMIQKGNRWMSRSDYEKMTSSDERKNQDGGSPAPKSDYDRFKSDYENKYQKTGETPTQKRIRLREESMGKDHRCASHRAKRRPPQSSP